MCVASELFSVSKVGRARQTLRTTGLRSGLCWKCQNTAFSASFFLFQPSCVWSTFHTLGYSHQTSPQLYTVFTFFWRILNAIKIHCCLNDCMISINLGQQSSHKPWCSLHHASQLEWGFHVGVLCFLPPNTAFLIAGLPTEQRPVAAVEHSDTSVNFVEHFILHGWKQDISAGILLLPLDCFRVSCCDHCEELVERSSAREEIQS